ncbi:phosphoglycerate mutase [Actinomycetota bacterium]|nr:phosphoglycerate mutase [Actinomycetota bacterium]
MSTTKIHLLRHGEVENPENVIYERLPDFHLSVRGQEMAKASADFIAKGEVMSNINQIYSSPLDRTIETARYASTALGGLPVKVDDRLIESQNKFAGKNVNQEIKRLANEHHYIQIFKYFNRPFTPSWGEPYVQVAQRMFEFIEEVRQKHQGEEVLIVSHQSPIWCVRRLYEHKNPQHNPKMRVCSLCSITSLIFNDEAGELVHTEYRTPAAHI